MKIKMIMLVIMPSILLIAPVHSHKADMPDNFHPHKESDVSTLTTNGNTLYVEDSGPFVFVNHTPKLVSISGGVR